MIIVPALLLLSLLAFAASYAVFPSPSGNSGFKIAMMSAESPKSEVGRMQNSAKGAVGIAASLLLTAARVSAKDVTESSLADSKKAAQTIKDALTKIGEIEAAGTDYPKMGKLLGEKCFTQFSDNAYILTKSSAVTPDDRIALGTIKRYGVVADAIIMMGGLAEALRAGGIEVAGGGGGYSDQAPIIDADSDTDDEDESEKKVNPAEVKKFIKLTKGAFLDIDKITGPILSK